MVFATLPHELEKNYANSVTMLCSCLAITQGKRKQEQYGSLNGNGTLKFPFSYYFQPFK